MKSNRRLSHVVLALALLSGLFLKPPGMLPASDDLPTRLTDQEFWRLTEEFSEEEGYFRSDNLLSNERWMQYVIPELLRETKPG